MVRWAQVQRHGGHWEDLDGDVFWNEVLPLIDQFFMFLCRVRRGVYEQDLAVRFNVSQATFSRVLLTSVNYLYFMLGSLPIWCSRTTVDDEMPECFRKTYPPSKKKTKNKNSWLHRNQSSDSKFQSSEFWNIFQLQEPRTLRSRAWWALLPLVQFHLSLYRTLAAFLIRT